MKNLFRIVLVPSLFLACVMSLVTVSRAVCQAGEIDEWIDGKMDELSRLYLHLHRNPEPSLHEKETAARIAQEWKADGYEVMTDVGGAWSGWGAQEWR